MSSGGQSAGDGQQIAVTLHVVPKSASPPATVTVGHPNGPLPFTGANVTAELGASALLLCAGALLAAVARRTRARI
ncbi:MAG TPA: hypothetical protein VKU88_10205 [Acidimicrobiales bacterium]|nr:hypothetical protein [Acidimicrobiales bacterium]